LRYYKQRRRQPTIQKSGGLFKGDALQVMRQFPSAQFRVIVTSPPYNLRNSSGHGLRDGRAAANGTMRRYYKVTINMQIA